MTLIKERRNNNTESEAMESENSSEDRRVNTNAASKLQINRPRELRYFGPVSVIPNTTYIRRLEHKGLLIPESKGCVLPALTSKTNAKRKKLDLLGVKNRWSCSIKSTFLFCNAILIIEEGTKEKAVQRNSLCARCGACTYLIFYISVNG